MPPSSISTRHPSETQPQNEAEYSWWLMIHQHRSRALNGALCELTHPDEPLTGLYTCNVDVLFDGVTHQLLSTADRSAFSFEHTTGEFETNGLRGLIVEYLDNVATSAKHRHQAIIESPSGVLSTWTYDGVDHLLTLIGNLRPTPDPLGMTVRPRAGAELGDPAIAIQTPSALLEITPLTPAVSDTLPSWTGTPVANGELFAGEVPGQTPYLLLVTDTCRVIAMPTDPTDPDLATAFLVDLDATWSS